MHGPTRVSVVATVTSTSALTSQLTGLRAAAFSVTLVERFMPGGRKDDAVPDLYEVLGTVILGEVLELAAEPIVVPLEAAQLRFATSQHGASAIEVSIPPSLAALAATARGVGMLCYREQTISHGDRFRIDAVIEPRATDARGGYRSSTRPGFFARADLGKIELDELLEIPRW